MNPWERPSLATFLRERDAACAVEDAIQDASFAVYNTWEPLVPSRWSRKIAEAEAETDAILVAMADALRAALVPR